MTVKLSDSSSESDSDSSDSESTSGDGGSECSSIESEQESDFSDSDSDPIFWVKCDNVECNKWRIIDGLSSEDQKNLQQQSWYCSMHPDKKQKDCVVKSGAPKTPRTAAKASEKISKKWKLYSDSDS
jgi:hypothetical protein